MLSLAGAAAYYEIVSVGDYSGTISVGSKSNVKIDAVALDAAPEIGACLAKLFVTTGGSVVNASAESVLDGATVALTVGGIANEAGAIYATDGLYLAVAAVDVTTTPEEGTGA